jgi:hypothetical protein
VSFFRFKDEDIINTKIVAYPSYTVELKGDQVTGSVYLEKQFLNNDLATRVFQGESVKEGGFVEKSGAFTASIDIVDVESGSTNSQLYESIIHLYDYYSIIDTIYTSSFTGSETTRFRVITVPEVYYDREILTGSFTASDYDNAGKQRSLYDNGRGGIYSGSLSGTLVGNIFYNEGLVVLKGGGLNDEAAFNDFGETRVAPSGVFGWTSQTAGSPYAGGFLGLGCNGSDLWVAVGTSGEVQTSPDGITWTSDDIGTGNVPRSVAYDGSGLWCIVGQSGLIFTSPDGIAWTQRTPGSSYSGNFIGVAHNKSDLWVAVGASGEVQTSPDGITWTSRSRSASFTLWNVAYNGSDLWTAVGDNQRIQTSPDGRTWTARTPDTYTGTFGGIAHNQTDLWVAVGFSGEIQTSPDGITWTTRSPGGSYSGDFYEVTYSTSAGLWVAVGSIGGIQTSPDGITWSKMDPDGGYTQTFRGLASDNNRNFTIVGLLTEIQTTTAPSNLKWSVDLKGTHNIPVKIFRCRAPAGHLNASTNPTYYQVPSGSADNLYEKEVVLTKPKTYITTVGLYNEDYELVGLAKVAQPIRKDENQDILFRLRLDF